MENGERNETLDAIIQKLGFFSLTMPLSEKTKGQMLEEKVDVSKFSTTC